MATRRRFLKLATGGAGVYLTSKFGLWPRVLAQIPGGTLPPDVIPKFVTPLLIPPAMPLAGSSPTTDYYAIAVRQFAQQILPARTGERRSGDTGPSPMLARSTIRRTRLKRRRTGVPK